MVNHVGVATKSLGGVEGRGVMAFPRSDIKGNTTSFVPPQVSHQTIG